MSEIRPEDILFAAGGAILEKYGTLSRRVAPIERGGEDIAETFTRAGTAWAKDQSGYFRSYATNVPRVQWEDADDDGVMDTPGLLVENARTNRCLESETFDVTWTTNITLSTNVGTAPDGTTTADRMTDVTANNFQFVYQTNVTMTADATLAFSVFAKAGTLDFVALEIADSGLSDKAIAWFDLSDGSVGTTGDEISGVFIRAYTEAYADGWWRCTIIGSIGGGHTDVDCLIYCSGADGVEQYTGDGSYIDIWGAQFEDAAISSSSYVQTTSAVATRGAESLAFPFYSPPQALSAYVKFIESGQVSLAGSERVLGLTNAGGAPERFLMYVAAGYYRVYHQTAAGAVNSDMAAAPGVGSIVELIGELSSDGSVQLTQSIDEAVAVSAASSAALTLGSAWSDVVLHVGGQAASNIGYNSFTAIVIARGSHTLADFREWLA